VLLSSALSQFWIVLQVRKNSQSPIESGTQVQISGIFTQQKWIFSGTDVLGLPVSTSEVE